MPFSTARLTTIAAFSMTSSFDRPEGRASRSSSACFSASAASCALPLRSGRYETTCDSGAGEG
jgi:hypothetical protein